MWVSNGVTHNSSSLLRGSRYSGYAGTVRRQSGRSARRILLNTLAWIAFSNGSAGFGGVLSGNCHQHQPILRPGGAWATRSLFVSRLKEWCVPRAPAEGRLILRDDSGDLWRWTWTSRAGTSSLDSVSGWRDRASSRTRASTSRECPLVNNDGIHLSTELTGKAYMKAGGIPSAWTGSITRAVQPGSLYQGPGLPYQRIPATRCTTRRWIRRPEARTVPGLNYRCYEGSNWNALPDFRRLTPVKRGIADKLRCTLVESRIDNVGLEFSGYIEVPRDGGVHGSPAPRMTAASCSWTIRRLLRWRSLEWLLTRPRVRRDQPESAGAGGQPMVGGGGDRYVRKQNSERVRDGIELRCWPHARRGGRRDRGDAPLFMLNSLVRVRGICRSTYTSEGQRVAGAMWRRVGAQSSRCRWLPSIGPVTPM